ncbi:TPA: GTP pyrophosphokinase [Vibrio vulnificus]|nr:GTP pyrophosphokinase [Vibrio vulnificus]
MANLQYKNQKKPLLVSKNEIDRAATSIRHGVIGDERFVAIKTIQNFREFHLYPLMLLKNHLVRTSAKISGKTNVARRLKRLSTIVDKLERTTLDGENANAIKLTRMQDIAGCRAIVKDLKKLKALQQRLEKSTSVHRIIKTRDYLVPKPSGYGGVHLIYSCYEGQTEPHEWKKAKVEVQLRTELQHAWATSLEIIDTLEQINLKTSHDGHEKWREFFSIAGKLVAHHETACIIEDPKELNNLRVRLADLSNDLEVVSKIARYTLAINFATDKKLPKQSKNGQGMFLVKMYHPNVEQKQIRVTVEFFRLKESDAALERLNEADLDETIAISALVSASDVRALKQAYPNYFGSTKKFVEFLADQVQLVED